MKLIKYKQKTHPFNTKYKILRNKVTAVQFYGISEFNSMDELCLAYQGERVGNWFGFNPPKPIDLIKENKRKYKVIKTFHTFEEFKNLYSEYFI